MNITLSANEETIRLTREYARQRGTSLNRLIRDFLNNLTSTQEGETAASEFSRLALEQGGRSPEGFRFDREDAHCRTG
jgi:hypothetical protein